MRTNKVENRITESSNIETANLARHDYWILRRRHSYASTRIRLL